MTKKHLSIFAAVFEENSITAAADRLYMTQPAVSLAIRQLEEYYGVRLFERLNRRLAVTDAGQDLYSYAIHILALFDEMETRLRDWDFIGRLRIGASITIGTQLMPKLSKHFQAEHPGIDLHVMIQSSDQLEEKLLKNDLDLALIEGYVHSGHLISEDFFDDSLAVLCHSGHPLLTREHVTAADLKGEKLLMRELASGTREFAQAMLSLHGLNAASPAWESSSTQAILSAVAEGIGISVLPLRLVDSYRHNDKICRLPVEDMEFKRRFKMVYHKNKFLTPAMKDFMELCRGLTL